MTNRRRLALVLALALLGGACSSAGSSAGPDQPAGGGDAATPPAVTPDGGPPDGGPPGDAATAGELPACLGASLPVTLTTGPHVRVPVGAAPSPYAGSFLVDYATTGSSIDLSTFAAPGPAATSCDPTLLGQLCTFADVDFFGAWGPVTLVTSTASILGTDFLAHGIYTLDYGRQRMLHATKSGACAAAELTAAGLRPLSAAGFFADDVSRLKLQRDVDSAAAAGLQVANVPIVPARIAGAAGIVQLDTGFDDSVVANSINVNVAFFDAISAASPGALLRDAGKDLTLSTCAGVSEPVEAYSLAPGRAFELVEEGGAVARAWTRATVFVKRTPLAAKRCGGIGTFTVPAAQIGTSFFADAGAVVFDPFASRVWLRR